MKDIDILIIGAGPAGIQAAIHASRRKMRVTVAGKLEKSALSKAHVENIFGISGKIEGLHILDVGKKQAESFGVSFTGCDVTILERVEDFFKAKLEDGTEFKTKSIIFALGVKRKQLKVKGEEEFLGKGVSYCADCDANFFKNKTVVVIGNESAAASAALLLKKVAKEVHFVSKILDIPEIMVAEIKSVGIIHHNGCSISEICGQYNVENIKLDNGQVIATDGVFIELGSKGSIELGTQIDVIPDMDGYVHVNRNMATNVPGVFACGDITGPPLQAAKATGEGCVAGLSATEYVKSLISTNDHINENNETKETY